MVFQRWVRFRKLVLLLLVGSLGLGPALTEIDVVIDVHSEPTAGHTHADFQNHDHRHGDADDHHHSQDGPCQHQSHCCCQHGATIVAAESLSTDSTEISTGHSCPGRHPSVHFDTHLYFHPPRA